MTLLVFFVFANFALLIPAFAFISSTKYRSISLILPLSYAANIAFYALIAVIFYTSKISITVIQLIFWLYFIAGLTLFLKNRYYKALLNNKFVLFCLLAMTIMSLSFISLSFNSSRKFIPDPQPISNRNYDVFSVKVLNLSQTPANDNSVPYRQAQFFTNRSDPGKDSFIEEWGVHFFQRTPLMGAVSSTIFIALNEKLPIDYIWSNTSSDPHKTYEQFQIISHILNSIIIIPAFFLIIKLFDRKTAKLTLLFVISSQFFIYNSVFSWPKTFVGFFILLSLLLLYEKKTYYTALAGVSAGLAYLSHDLAVLYLGAIFLILLFKRRYRDIFIYGLFWIVFVVPWALLSALKYDKPSSFPLYPISVDGIPQPALRDEIINKFFSTSIWRLIQIRLESLYYLLSPYQLIYSEGGQDAGRRAWALGLFSVPGAIGFGTVSPAVAGIFKNLRKWDVLIMIFVPIVLSTIVIGWPKGLGALHFAQASVILLIAIASSWLLTIRKKWLFILVMALNLLQLIFFTIYSYGDSYKKWLNIQDVISILIMSAIFVVTLLIACKMFDNESENNSKKDSKSRSKQSQLKRSGTKNSL